MSKVRNSSALFVRLPLMILMKFRIITGLNTLRKQNRIGVGTE